jgi:hypothetical protein
MCCLVEADEPTNKEIAVATTISDSLLLGKKFILQIKNSVARMSIRYFYPNNSHAKRGFEYYVNKGITTS